MSFKRNGYFQSARVYRSLGGILVQYWIYSKLYGGSCALNKKGCHFPAAPTGNPSHTRRVSRKLRAPPRPPLFARANFSRLNFDSGAKILRDIIKYDYPAKVEEKKETARGDASREVQGGGRSRGEEEKRKREDKVRKDAEKKQKEATEVGRRTTGGRVRLKVKSCRGIRGRDAVRALLEGAPASRDTGVVQPQRVTRRRLRAAFRAEPGSACRA